jgi:hypothetical protein
MFVIQCDICKKISEHYIGWRNLGELPSDQYPNLSSIKEACQECSGKIDQFIAQLINEADNART